MESENLASPQPIFPSGSVVSGAIPLLADSPTIEPGEVQAVNDEVESKDASRETDTPTVVSPEAGGSVPEEKPDSDVSIVDDGLVSTASSHQPPPVSAETDPHKITEAVPMENANDASPSTDLDENDNPALQTSEMTQLSLPSQTTTTTTATPGLPPGVDLQKLLSTFSTMTDLPLSESQPSQSATVVPAPKSPESLPESINRPTVPWQNTAAPVVQSKPSSNSAQSNDALYEQFLVDEKRIMGNTAPHEFEPGSRLFIGNMNIDTINKRQVFFIFKKYGKLAQVALKSTYGFVQFLTARECRAAVDGEQGLDIAGKKLHLEVCKPQPARNAAPAQNRRRSRSPPRKSSSSMSYGRDNYETYKRPASPPRRSSPGRFHTPHDAHYPPRRSPSPRRYANPPPVPIDPLPPRYGSQVPEVQIVVLDQSDRSYIHWVESSIRQAGFKVESLILSPQLELPVVVRQMAKEGVLAIVHCHRQLQMVNKVTLQVFDRSQGSSVRFDEYAGLDITAAIAVLKRSQQQAYAARAPAPPAPQQANLAAMIAQMDPASLQQVIGALSQQQQQGSAPPSSYPGSSSYPYRRY